MFILFQEEIPAPFIDIRFKFDDVKNNDFYYRDTGKKEKVFFFNVDFAIIEVGVKSENEFLSIAVFLR